MAGKNTRNEIWSYSIFGTVVLAGTVALMMFGLNSSVSADIGPLLAGLALSTYVFRCIPLRPALEVAELPVPCIVHYRPELAGNYEARAMYLRPSPGAEAVAVT